MYARERQRTRSRSSNHRCRSSERALGRARVSSEMRRDHVGTLAFGRRTDAVDLLRADPPASHRFLRGPVGMRPRRLLREVLEPPRPHAVVPSGTILRRSHGARQGRNTLPSPDVRVGDAEAAGPQGETSSMSGRRETRGSIENESIQSPREHRAGAQRKRRALATDSSTEESPEVGEQSSAPWRHGSEHGSERREGTPAGERDRVRKNEAR
jgi:hypothetical protein